MADDNFSSGVAFGHYLANALPGVAHAAQMAISPLAPAAGNTIVSNATGPRAQAGADFLTGALGMGRPSVTIPYASIPLRAAPAPKAAAAAPAPKAKAAAAPAAPAAANAALDPAAAAALGKLSFRQLLSLGETVDKTSPRGAVARPTPAADAAGNLLMQMTLPSLQNSLQAAKTDDEKHKLIDTYNKNYLQGIISHGNPMAGLLDPNGG